MQKITPFLWFDNNAEEAINFYASVFKNVQIKTMAKYPGGPMAGKVMMGSFVLEGQEFKAMDAGPIYKFTEAISMFVDCETQEEVDEYWTKLTANGGQESQCGWLKDRFGLSWQIIPKQLGALLGHKDPVKAQRALQAMLGMKKIDISQLKQAFEGK